MYVNIVIIFFFSVAQIQYETFNGPMKQISFYNNIVWAVGMSNGITFRSIIGTEQQLNWQSFPGNETWISNGPTEVWRVNANKKIEFCTKPCNGIWNKINGAFKQVSVGEDEVWGVNQAGTVFLASLPFSSLDYYPETKLQNIAVGKNFVYGVNSNSSVLRCENPCNGIWDDIPGSLVQISASLQDDSVFGINAANELQKWNGYDWQKIGDTQLINVHAINATTIVGCTPEGDVKLGLLY